MDWNSPSPSAVGPSTEGSDGETESEDDEAISELDWPHKLEADTTQATPSEGKFTGKDNM